jgi:hypothetical protein
LSKQIYIFSGLGADERAFTYLSFTGWEVNFIKWEVPDKEETIASYTKKLAKQITAVGAIYIRLSFGGMMATEVSKLIKPKQLILIASAKNRSEIPPYYKWVGVLRLHKLLPTLLLKKSSFIADWFFGVKTKNDKKLLAEILRDTNSHFLKWAINKIVHWQNQEVPGNCTHIHGTADRILPYCFVQADIAVKGGGHFMTVNKYPKINAIVNGLLNM